ncbi:unnamed protein product [Vitrella brassicaformis CCMP3155]|uniref:DUF5675 domain-containing protein n=1 Tax=Vitrella brassicaformis (strain CCMP3155) TaxID=1169540 RepID=A0A0G4F3J0_VITBC|nr:unnamed protein product [Vitrella brassicaformis CCMP3155]|mmetsp:Transcript_28864/g.71989  ORF Transcript_28864/g.71989 Transcript_28864/m.71989 type:complete len:133 (-) Transcript_28864:332-730(-)|eukprot:CEM06622.1 unnamed protein product [Vitrella brassicaformis CCMP3155]
MTSSLAIVITRDSSPTTHNSITARMGTFSCSGVNSSSGHTLENEGQKIPTGTYSAFVRRDRQMPRIQLQDVPGRTEIQIHTGNWVKDVTGCILPGTGTATDEKGPMVTNSGAAMNKMMEGVVDGTKITVTVM